MELKCIAILVAVTFVAFVKADPCGREKSNECLDAYMSASLEEKTDAEKCSDKRDVSRCLTEAAEACQGDDSNEDLDKAVRQMNQALAEECGDEDYRKKRELEYRRKRELEYRRKRELEYRRKRELEYRRKRELEYRRKRELEDWLPMTAGRKR